jgi:hypothetical protein
MLLTTLALLLGLIACSVSGAEPPPLPTTGGDAETPDRTPAGGDATPSPLPPSTVTPLPSITPLDGSPAASATRTAAPTGAPTLARTNTPAPLATATRPAASPTATRAGATAAWAGLDEVLIFLILRDDNGASGPLVGCGDSAVGVRREIAPTRGVLRAALNELLSLRDEFYGESGLYNALYQSNLTLDDVTIVSGTAMIELSGALVSGGVCDDPRIIAQIEYTARQFSTVRAVEITVNGTDIHDVLSGR